MLLEPELTEREPPLSATTGAEVVHHTVREAILRGDLAPGVEMSQVQLARQLGVSRTPLREALRMLQREGLVEGEANRQIRVASFSIGDLEQVYALRIVNEALGVRVTVPALTAVDDTFLDESLERMARYADERSIDVWEAHHRSFHDRLVSGAGDRLRRLLSELSDHSERYRRLYIEHEPRAWSAGAAEHTAIVDACRARDPIAAAASLARHLSRTALTVLMYVSPDHEPAVVRGALRTVLGSEGALPPRKHGTLAERQAL